MEKFKEFIKNLLKSNTFWIILISLVIIYFSVSLHFDIINKKSEIVILTDIFCIGINTSTLILKIRNMIKSIHFEYLNVIADLIRDESMLRRGQARVISDLEDTISLRDRRISELLTSNNPINIENPSYNINFRGRDFMGNVDFRTGRPPAIFPTSDYDEEPLKTHPPVVTSLNLLEVNEDW